jgi:hypothetical protein
VSTSTAYKMIQGRVLVRTAVLLCVCLLGSATVDMGSVFAAPTAPGFMVESFSSPTRFAAADSSNCETNDSYCDTYTVRVRNVGSRATDGSAVRVVDELPVGLAVRAVEFSWTGSARTGIFGSCSSVPVECSLPAGVVVNPDDALEMTVHVMVEPGTSGRLSNVVKASGGGAAEAENTQVTEISSATPPFGFSEFDFHPSGMDGLFDSQAASHPYELTVVIGFNNVLRLPPDTSQLETTTVEDIKDVAVDLPLGFVGSTLAAPQCTLSQLSSEQRCPLDTRVGHISSSPHASASVNSPIWNLVPEHGVPAEFGYVDELKSSHVFYTHVVPTAAGYVLQTLSPDIPQIALNHVVVTFYGDPAVRDQSGGAEIPFFTNPTTCSAAGMTATVYMDSWRHPGRFNGDETPDLKDPAWVSRGSTLPAPTGCNVLQFGAELGAQPTTEAADSPSGLDFELKLAQSEQAETNATPPLRDASVTFPEGFTLDPSSGDGLQACSETQIGWEEDAPGPMKFNVDTPQCPEASKVGILELTTPLIPGTLTGEVYLARQDENPFHTTFGLYLVVKDPITGVLVKIAGHVHTDPSTGRITGVFDENPQLPFSDLKLHFFGGPRAVFATPEACGHYTTTADLSPWSAPDSGPDSMAFVGFPITASCVSGFTPMFAAGSMNLQAGAYTPFVASFSRKDTDQNLAGLSVTLPPGILAKIAGVPLCTDVEAASGACPQASRVGGVIAEAGPGPAPLMVSGSAYLTGPYEGAPYGLVVEVPAIAGPFDFGNVVVRQAIHIDPQTAQVTVVSDPFPTILRPTGADGEMVGVPIRLRGVDVSIDRPTFTFNPTNCSRLQVKSAITSTQDQVSPLVVPFQATDCRALKFTPKFHAATSGHPSKASGASLTVHLSYPKAAQGSQANIASVKVSLPKQLPSRLTTLQRACLAAVFNSNPASCPSASIIGHAVVSTPLLPRALSGPAYFVSHGGESFPSLTIVVQGNGVTIDLTGSTLIRRGITSTTFKALPDVPFSTFQLTLPKGPFSALAANGDPCRTRLIMPILFHAQNGAETHHNIRIAVTGCRKRHHKHPHRHAAIHHR